MMARAVWPGWAALVLALVFGGAQARASQENQELSAEQGTPVASDIVRELPEGHPARPVQPMEPSRLKPWLPAPSKGWRLVEHQGHLRYEGGRYYASCHWSAAAEDEKRVMVEIVDAAFDPGKIEEFMAWPDALALLRGGKPNIEDYASGTKFGRVAECPALWVERGNEREVGVWVPYRFWVRIEGDPREVNALLERVDWGGLKKMGRETDQGPVPEGELLVLGEDYLEPKNNQRQKVSRSAKEGGDIHEELLH